MEGFKEREKGNEAKYKVDQELKFKATVIRDRMMARWAAEQMGLPEERVGEYETEVVKAAMEAPGDEDIISKIQRDLRTKGHDVSDDQLKAQLDSYMLTAIEEARDRS